ncbi:MAG: hypothetical protein NVV70_03785 [Cellulomonas sp.]|nr:hypothetical protein [Cellulomonas sp.]MCR6647289.1 hypothetical protein [Cellulomonas sp.]
MQTFPAGRATRSGALVIVTDPDTARSLVGELVELVGQDGATAHGRIATTGTTWVDENGAARTYAYVDPTTVVTDAA